MRRSHRPDKRASSGADDAPDDGSAFLSLVATPANSRPQPTHVHRHFFAIVIKLTCLDLSINAMLIQLRLKIRQVMRHLFIAFFIGSLRLKIVSRHQPFTSHCAINAVTLAGFSTISQTIHEILFRFDGT